jgi:hypothetical protein
MHGMLLALAYKSMKGVNPLLCRTLWFISIGGTNMFTKKSLGIALGCALALGASGAALANPIDVNGVHWDSSSPFDLTIQSLNLRETSVANPGDVLTGYGQIGSINGNNNFCSGCDLTFTYTYTVDSVTGNQVVFSDGTFQFYTQAAGSFNFGDPTSVNGTPWVTLTGHTSLNGGTGSIGELFATVVGTAGAPQNGSSGFGLVDATGGPAAFWLHSSSNSDGMGGWADFFLSSSFSFFPATGCGTTPTTNLNDICTYPIQGNGSLTGKSVAVPEPGTAGLLGLGLGFLGFLIQRRRKEA